MTTKTQRIQFRTTKNEYDRIKNKAKASGLPKMADYIRYTLLEKDLVFERKFEEVHEAILMLIKKLK